MDLKLTGRVALVNGASQGIGYGIAHTLAEEGVRVAVAARREVALSAAAERIRSETRAEIIPIQGDIRKADDCIRIVSETVKHFGSLQILTNNDGAPRWDRSLSLTTRLGVKRSIRTL